MSPVNLRRIGVPLWIVVIPDICHPLKMPLVTTLSKPPRASFGRLQLYDRLKTCVRSNGRTPQLLPRVSIGSAHAEPSLSFVATVPNALPNVYVAKYWKFFPEWLNVACNEWYVEVPVNW